MRPESDFLAEARHLHAVDKAGNISDTDTRQFLQGWIDRYVAWVKAFSPS